MPFALLLRVLLRLAGALIFWRVATARRGAAATGGRRVRSAPPPPRLELRERVAHWRENASLAWRLTALAVFVGMTVVLIAAGLGPALLGPRWLGILLLVLAAVALGGVTVESLALQRFFIVRSRRRHDKDLARQVYP